MIPLDWNHATGVRIHFKFSFCIGFNNLTNENSKVDIHLYEVLIDVAAMTLQNDNIIRLIYEVLIDAAAMTPSESQR